MEKILTRGMSFVDEYGRERIFNGVNLCDKGWPDENGNLCHVYEYDDKMFRALAERGFNIVRLGITWAAVEPEPGKYNEKYIDGIRKMLDQCRRYGLYAYIDMHQDLYSSYCYQWGDGAPKWACMMNGDKQKKIKIVWAEGYFWDRGIHKAFDSFWANKTRKGKGLLDYFADMWAHLAKRLGDHPALFGFDMLNEPFPGSDGGKVFRQLIKGLVKTTLTDKRIDRCKLIKDAVKLDIPAVLEQYSGEVLHDIALGAAELVEKFDRERYTPFLNKTAAAIRSVTDNGIMFIDNCYYSNLSVPCKAGPITYGGKPEEKMCFAPHGYDLMVDTPLYKYAGSSRTDAIFGEHEKSQKRLSVPVIVGEWGGYSEGTAWYPHVHHLLRFFDERKWSNTYWAFHEGLINDGIMEELHRPYPRAVTGEIKSYLHDRSENTFTLFYEQNECFDSKTVVYLPSEPKEIDCTGEYVLIPCEFGGFTLEVKTDIGSHGIKVKL